MASRFTWHCFLMNDDIDAALYVYSDDSDKEYAMKTCQEYDNECMIRSVSGYANAFICTFSSETMYNMFCMHIEINKGAKR
jgi:hypothetical protein